MEGKNGLYGYLSGLATAFALQPLENIKMVLMLPPKNANLGSNFLKNISTATRYLYHDAGIKAFYRGTVPSMLKTALSNSIYFSVLRQCENVERKYYQTNTSVISCFLSSMTARITAALVTNPLQIIETRFEYAGQERWKGGVLHSLKKIYKYQGFYGFFKGGMVTCFKEGIFAGLFYTLYNLGRKSNLNSFIAGVMAGMISTSITHPFQIARAEMQSDIITKKAQTKNSASQLLKNLIIKRQAFRGLAPRLMKKPLSNTFAFLIFERMERKSQ